MDFTLKKTLDIAQLREHLQDSYPLYKIKTPRLNKRMIQMRKGSTSVTVVAKKQGLNISSGLNTKNFGIALGIGIGAVLGLVGAIIFLIIIFAVKSDDFKKAEADVWKTVSDYIKTQQKQV